MISSNIAILATTVLVNDESLNVDLSDGRSIVVPIVWFPRLAHGSQTEKANWRLVGKGSGIHWPDLDEDISIDSLLAGRPSDEDSESLQRWLDGRLGR